MKWGALHNLQWLWILIPAALYIFYRIRKRKMLLNKLAEETALKKIMPDYNPGKMRWKHILWLCAFACSLLAFARPQWGFSWEEVKRKGLDIMIVLDTSNSMLAEDIKPNRLTRAKWGLSDLVRQLKGDRIGLVAFSGSSFLQCPLTIDYAAFMMTLDDVYAGIIPRGGTEIDQALQTAMDNFEVSGKGDKVIILITDGESHSREGGILKKLQNKEIKVFSVGVGTTSGELINIQDQKGNSTYLKDNKGNVVKSSLREDYLEQLALGTGGMYLRSLPGDFGLGKIYEQGILNLQRDELESNLQKRFEDRFVLFLGLAFLLLLLESSLGVRSLSGGKLLQNKTYGISAMILFFIFASPAYSEDFNRRFKEGIKRYKEKDYVGAELSFKEALKLTEENPGGEKAHTHYNYGQTLYKQEDYEEAEKHFRSAEASNASKLQEQSYFKRGNIHAHLAEKMGKEQKVKEAMDHFTTSMNMYENALRLNPANQKTKKNYELALNRWQELKEKLPPPSEEDKEQEQEQEQQDQEEQNKNQQSQNEQQEQQSSEKNKEQQDQEKESEKDEASSENNKEQDESEKDAQESSPANDENNEQQEEDGKQAGQESAEDMTSEEAMMMLDAMREEEQAKRDKTRVQHGKPVKVLKDW